MGRGKIEIKRIENDNSRQVTFTKRRNGLLKKAHELAVLCDAQVAVIGYSSTGKVFDFASSSMEQILSRYNKCLETLGTPKVKHGAQKDANEVAVLKKEFETLQAEQMHVLGKDLTGLGLKELQELELILNEGLLSVNDKMEKILMAQLEESRMKEHMAMLENETLRKQIEELHGYSPISATPISAFHEYNPERERSPVKDGVSSLETVFCAETMTALQLGLTPSPGYRKRKAPEKETADKETGSGTSGSQLEM